jgi:aminoglycoside 6'-N-acetyltransferase
MTLDLPNSIVKLALRPLSEDDLPAVSRWSKAPHVDYWWHEAQDLAKVRENYLPMITGADPTHPLIVEADGKPIGLAQWCWWRDYPDEAARRGATTDEVGMDYFIGEQSLVGHGVGTLLVAELLAYVRAAAPTSGGALVDPEGSNRASCRVLEKNGFCLVEVRQIDDPASQPLGPTAVYRLRFDEVAQ